MSNGYNFEHYYHLPTDIETALPFDYVPSYNWLDEEAARLWASRVAYSKLFAPSNSLVSENRKATFVTHLSEIEEISPVLLLIEAWQVLRGVAAQLSPSDDSKYLEPYLKRVQEITGTIEERLKPRPDSYFFYVVVNVGDSE